MECEKIHTIDRSILQSAKTGAVHAPGTTTMSIANRSNSNNLKLSQKAANCKVLPKMLKNPKKSKIGIILLGLAAPMPGALSMRKNHSTSLRYIKALLHNCLKILSQSTLPEGLAFARNDGKPTGEANNIWNILLLYSTRRGHRLRKPARGSPTPNQSK